MGLIVDSSGFVRWPSNLQSRQLEPWPLGRNLWGQVEDTPPTSASAD